MRLLLVALALAAPHQPVVADCNAYAVAPASLTIACGDGNFGLARMRWRHWGAPRATGTGVVRANDCTPSCAAGRFHDYPVVVTASALATCPGGLREYTHLGFRYTAASQPTTSAALPCSLAARLGPQLGFGRRGPDLVVQGSAWPHCGTTVTLSSGGTAATHAPVGADGTFTASWHASWGGTVVAKLTCGARFYEAVASR